VAAAALSQQALGQGTHEDAPFVPALCLAPPLSPAEKNLFAYPAWPGCGRLARATQLNARLQCLASQLCRAQASSVGSILKITLSEIE
jgi:hypothetical protein